MMKAEELKDGIHFGLPDEIYHQIAALSASGIKHLLISPMDFWACSWMNPLKEDKETDAKIIGKAYHKRLLEGKDPFYKKYTLEFEAPDGALKTVQDIKDAFTENGFTLNPKARKEELATELHRLAPSLPIYDILKAEWEEENEGKIPLSIELIRRIEIAAAMIEKHPELSKCFTGGYPEVTIIWTDGGVRFKARFDYLKPRAIIDLKTFANMLNRPIDRAIYHAMASEKYHIQATFYLRAAAMAAEIAKHYRGGESPSQIFFHDGHPQVPWEWIKLLAECEEHDFYFVFQQKGIAPVARGKKFPRGLVYGAGNAAIEDAISHFKRLIGKFGTDAWIDETPIDSFEDSFFPAYTTEI